MTSLMPAMFRKHPIGEPFTFRVEGVDFTLTRTKDWILELALDGKLITEAMWDRDFATWNFKHPDYDELSVYGDLDHFIVDLTRGQTPWSLVRTVKVFGQTFYLGSDDGEISVNHHTPEGPVLIATLVVAAFRAGLQDTEDTWHGPTAQAFLETWMRTEFAA